MMLLARARVTTRVGEPRYTRRMPRMHASVTDEAHLIWRQFTTTQGTTTAALCEALAPELERLVDLPEPRWPVMWREVTLRSRSIAAERRFR